MAIRLDIVPINRLKDDAINYNNTIFSFRAADVMDIDGTANLLLACRTLIEGGAKKLLVDMEGLTFIDSSGIGALIQIAKHVRSKSGDMALMRVPASIELIFKPVNLQRFIGVHATLEDAINFFRFV